MTARQPRESLVEKYRPMKLEDFTGLDRERRILMHFAQNPYSAAFLLVGPSGCGKTTMALALGATLGAEVRHVPSRRCDLETVDDIVHRCHYVPLIGDWHYVLVDEADQATRPAQLAFLSALDTTGMPPNTIWVFTANSVFNLEDRFISRCRTIVFDVAGLHGDIVALLKRVWAAEMPKSRHVPPYDAIVEKSKLNFRTALNDLEIEMIAPGSFRPDPSKAVQVKPEPAVVDAAAVTAKPAVRQREPEPDDPSPLFGRGSAMRRLQEQRMRRSGL